MPIIDRKCFHPGTAPGILRHQSGQLWSPLCLSYNSDHQNSPGTNSAPRGIESFSTATPDKEENDRFGLASLDTLLGDLQSMKSIAASPREPGYTIQPWAGLLHSFVTYKA